MPLIDPITMGSAAQAPQKTSLPVDVLPGNLARIFTSVHPAVLLSVYCLRFPAFVINPISTLLNSLLPLVVLQIAYAVCCLPPTGSGSSSKPVKKGKTGSKKSSETSPSRAMTIFFALFLALLSVPLLAGTQILFGAPITTHIPQTLLSSTHLALLAVFPLVYIHGSDRKKWREIVSAYSPIDEVFGGAVGCFLGAWLGAAPIPLDWDREWQKWPVTIVTGAYIGYVVGKLAGGWVLRGKRIEFD